jgi:outer membrane protein assembly factor BamB
MRRSWSLGWLVGVALVAAAAMAPPGPAAAATADDWPTFHHDPLHTGRSAETVIGAASAASLGLVWQANTGQATNTAPAVVHNPTLGRRLVYQGDTSGVMTAFDAGTGERVWSHRVAGDVNSSPAVAGGVVYFGSDDHRLYAVDATTGARICSFDTGGVVNSSPVVATTAQGTVVYVGDNGFGGSNDGGHVWAVNGVHPNAAGDCSRKWVFDAFGDPPGSQPLAGSWSPPAFATDGRGRQLVVIGSSSPDNAVYAFDALTGAVAWRFQTEQLFPDGDVGTGPAIAPPGANGVADGLVYVVAKTQILYAINLTTGAKAWEFRIRDDAPGAGSARSSPALAGDRVYLGYGAGVYAIDAVTGSKVWRVRGDTGVEVISSPAVAGAVGDQVVLAADVAGRVYALRATDGVKLWSYATGGPVYSSPAVSGGLVLLGSLDGFLYAFGLGGGASAKPTVVITSPADGASLANPRGSLTLTGSAGDDTGVERVLVSVKDRNSGKWWDGTSQTWSRFFAQNQAALSALGATATGWSYAFPVGPAGGSFLAYADAVDRDGQHGTPVPSSRFVVASLGSPPDTTITVPTRKQVFNFPPSGGVSFPVTAEGMATDGGGRTPGIASVNVVVTNIEHREYYCGPSGCPGAPSVYWRPTYTVVQAVLTSPGATSTRWSLGFPVYDHAHKYSVSAWAVDRDGERDPTKARVSPICVRDAGVRSCI